MTALTGVDFESGLTHTMHGKLGNVNEVVEAHNLHQRKKTGHPFQLIERYFELVKVRYLGLPTSMARLDTPFALSKLWLA